MMTLEKAASLPRAAVGDAGPRSFRARARAASRTPAAQSADNDILGGAYGASWRESHDILFALKATPEGLVFDAINPACEASLGLASAAVAGRSPAEVLAPAASGAFLVSCLQCAASAKPTRFTHAMALEPRRRRWDTTLTPICDASGAVFLILGCSREVAASSRAGQRNPSRADGETGAAARRARTLTVDRNWRLTAITPQAAEWMGRRPGELVGRNARETLRLTGAMFDAVDAALAIGQPSRVRQRSVYRPGHWLDFQVEPTDAGAKISFRDSTSEVAGLVDDGSGDDTVEMALLDARGVILSVNRTWRETFTPRGPGERSFGVGAPYEDICRQLIPDLDAGVLREAMRQLLAREVLTLTHAYVVVTAAGPRWRQIRILPLKDDVANFIAVHEDLTELARSQAALRRTSAQLITAQQEERQRIAIELHESTGAHLAALGLGVRRLRRLMRARADAGGILDDMAASIDEAAKEIRVMSYLMKPPSLHRDGLEATARRYVKGFGIRTGLNTVFRCEGPVDRMSAVIQHAAFRVIQEALSNVHRHARATAVEVELVTGRAELTLRVADDGQGIAPPRRARLEGIPPGVGIPGMRSRVEHLGGGLQFADSRAGAIVTARIPLPQSARAPSSRSRTARQ
ncbi:MAG TPA: PAS domain-containing protein [Caulobacteraceae bacterium]